jgi:hypothetical protein
MSIVKELRLVNGVTVTVFDKLDESDDPWRWLVCFDTSRLREIWHVEACSIPCRFDVLSDDGRDLYTRDGSPVGSPWWKLTGFGYKLIEDPALLAELDAIFHACGGWRIWGSNGDPAEAEMRKKLDDEFAEYHARKLAAALVPPPMIELWEGARS